VVNGVMRIDLPPVSLSPSLGLSGTLTAESSQPAPCYVAGPENQLPAYVLKHLLAESPEPSDPTWTGPLSLVGPTGSGKSLIAQGVTRRWISIYGADAVMYLTAKSFTLELAMARADNVLSEFRNRFSKLRLLVIEDLHKLTKKTAPQRELRDLFDTLQDSMQPAGTVLVTSQESPAAMRQLEDGLRDRLLGGLLIKLNHPGVAARQELLQLAASSCGLSLQPERIAALAERKTTSAAQIMRCIREFAIAPVVGQNPGDLRPGQSFKEILATVARYYGLTQTALRSTSRRKSLVHARGVAIYLARTLTDMSYTDLGKQLGNRDHTTIIHAMQNLEKLLLYDATTQEDVNELRRVLTSV